MHTAGLVDMAEKTNIIGAVDGDAGDCLVVAVELAGEFLRQGLVRVADGSVGV